MNFRYARHTNDLNQLSDFYQNIIGLTKLGEFKEHDGYDGVFLGLEDSDWHIEFTQSQENVKHMPDKDDLIVFYLKDDNELNTIVRNAEKNNCFPVVSQNPYWNVHGVELTDPDGFGVILTVRRF